MEVCTSSGNVLNMSLLLLSFYLLGLLVSRGQGRSAGVLFHLYFPILPPFHLIRIGEGGIKRKKIKGNAKKFPGRQNKNSMKKN